MLRPVVLITGRFFISFPMRIVITADLHYRAAYAEQYATFGRRVAELQPDCFVLAGDIGSPLTLFQRCLRLFGMVSCPRLLVAGNHDLYRHGRYDSRSLWESWLPHICAAENVTWLEGQAFILGDVAVCGTMAWYDYSSAAPHLALSDHDYRLGKGMVNHDADYIDWPWSDRAMARYLATGFMRTLTQLQMNPTVKQIVVVTHMPPFSETIPVHLESEFWSLLSAYLGNYTLGDWLRRQSKVTHVISGHIHRAGRWTVAGEHGAIDFRVVGSQPGAPALVVLDIEHNI